MFAGGVLRSGGKTCKKNCVLRERELKGAGKGEDRSSKESRMCETAKEREAERLLLSVEARVRPRDQLSCARGEAA